MKSENAPRGSKLFLEVEMKKIIGEVVALAVVAIVVFATIELCVFSRGFVWRTVHAVKRAELGERIDRAVEAFKGKVNNEQSN